MLLSCHRTAFIIYGIANHGSLKNPGLLAERFHLLAVAKFVSLVDGDNLEHIATFGIFTCLTVGSPPGSTFKVLLEDV